MKFSFMVMRSKYIVFDLDDTLMYEIDYLKSAYRQIAAVLDRQNRKRLYDEMWAMYRQGADVFKELSCRFPDYSKEVLLKRYREHFPDIEPTPGAKELMAFCKGRYKMGLLTDGRSLTQKNKLKALGMAKDFDKIIISETFGSEKPDERNFRAFMKGKERAYFYIADNTRKDFIAPNILGWDTICLLDQGCHIHDQDFSLPEMYLPKHKVKSLYEVKDIIEGNRSGSHRR